MTFVASRRGHRHSARRAFLLAADGTAQPTDHVGEFRVPSAQFGQQVRCVTALIQARLALEVQNVLTKLVCQFFDLKIVPHWPDCGGLKNVRPSSSPTVIGPGVGTQTSSGPLAFAVQRDLWAGVTRRNGCRRRSNGGASRVPRPGPRSCPQRSYKSGGEIATPCHKKNIVRPTQPAAGVTSIFRVTPRAGPAARTARRVDYAGVNPCTVKTGARIEPKST